jgi:hypothetical protein
MTRKRERALLSHEEVGKRLKFPKLHALIEAQMDTSELPLSKIHPFRDPRYLRWLRYQSCVIAGLTDLIAGQLHVCWSPRKKLAGGRYPSDPAHLEKAYSGRLKRDDRYAIPLCRLGHKLHEGADERFAQRFGINTKQIAEEHYARFKKERGE